MQKVHHFPLIAFFHIISSSFHSIFMVLFIFPSRYFYIINHWFIFLVWEWFPNFPFFFYFHLHYFLYTGFSLFFSIIFFFFTFSYYWFRSPLLSISLLISFPPTTKKFQFMGFYLLFGFPLDTLLLQINYKRISVLTVHFKSMFRYP